MSKGQFLKAEMLTPELLGQLRQWNEEAGAQGRSLAEHALRWILDQQGITSVLVGASSVGQLERNLQAMY
jgi:L-glyceraldehyde 3-phosphate reductase